ncbi:MAG: iron ABC transporter permease, partial [Deltaproteobacteria bacterium]|nr:iron ABC transporter permease [Deltaproteobacteria bacterium]
MSFSHLLNPEMPLFLLGIIVSAFICGLVALVLWTTFVEGLPGVDARFSLANYEEVLLDPFTLRAGFNTLFLGAGTVLVNLFFALPIAWLIHRTDTPWKSFFLTLMFLHIVLPGFLRVMGWIMLLSPEIGLINQMLRIFIPVESGPISIYNISSMAFVQGLILTPTMFFMISGPLLAVDPALEECAEVAGSNRFQCLRLITFPMIKPAILGAVIYNFMTAISMYEVAALLGAANNIQVFSTLMFSAFSRDIGLPRYGIAGVYGILLLLPTLIALKIYLKTLRASHRYETVTGKGYKLKLIEMGRWKWAALSFIGVYFVLDIFLPFLAVTWTSLVPRIQLPTTAALATITAQGYRSAWVLLFEGGVLSNTVQLVISVAISVIVLSLVISWIVVRSTLPGRYIIDTISLLPHAIPRIAFAFSVAFFGLLLARRIPLYGSLASVIIAHAVAYIAFGTRSINAALVQIHRDLEEAVETCGGSRIAALKGIILPLVLPSLFYTTVWVGLLS